METLEALRALQEVENRAERVGDEHVIETYVNAGGLINALQSRDNGIIYGRRGTGKTHALRYLRETRRAAGDLVIYIDMEQDLGSTGGLYSDRDLSLPERATRLLVDVLNHIHEILLEEAFDNNGLIDPLDRVLDHFGEIVVKQSVEHEGQTHKERVEKNTASITATPRQLSLQIGGEESATGSRYARQLVKGAPGHRVHFGAVSRYFQQAINDHPAPRCWLLFDEWSGIPYDLQPYLAEMLRKVFFGAGKVTTRIAAIPHRSNWRIDAPDDYIGLEIGAEIFPTLDLDEFVVFPARNKHEQTEKSTSFFRELIYRHVVNVLPVTGGQAPETNELIKALFTQSTALQEVVRAAEGVPRDALNITTRAGLRAGDRPISTDHVRAAAGQVFQTTKSALLNARPEARLLLDLIVDEVISNKKARAFLIAQSWTDDQLIQQLIDDRILHLIKRGYSSKDNPGERFDVLQIDYGCYVSQLGTASAPSSMLGVGVDDDALMASMYENVEVPEDDYRAIRRAILDLPSKLAEVGRRLNGRSE